jgi:hypothetical protein
VQGHELSLAELLLREPEIVAWLEPEETVCDEDDAEAGMHRIGP